VSQLVIVCAVRRIVVAPTLVPRVDLIIKIYIYLYFQNALAYFAMAVSYVCKILLN
jgi:hypothetical protein